MTSTAWCWHSLPQGNMQQVGAAWAAILTLVWAPGGVGPSAQWQSALVAAKCSTACCRPSMCVGVNGPLVSGAAAYCTMPRHGCSSCCCCNRMLNVAGGSLPTNPPQTAGVGVFGMLVRVSFCFAFVKTCISPALHTYPIRLLWTTSGQLLM